MKPWPKRYCLSISFPWWNNCQKFISKGSKSPPKSQCAGVNKQNWGLIADGVQWERGRGRWLVFAGAWNCSSVLLQALQVESVECAAALTGKNCSTGSLGSGRALPAFCHRLLYVANEKFFGLTQSQACLGKAAEVSYKRSQIIIAEWLVAATLLFS